MPFSQKTSETRAGKLKMRTSSCANKNINVGKSFNGKTLCKSLYGKMTNMQLAFRL